MTTARYLPLSKAIFDSGHVAQLSNKLTTVLHLRPKCSRGQIEMRMMTMPTRIPKKPRLAGQVAARDSEIPLYVRRSWSSPRHDAIR
jgi:hypothetical protein